MEAEMKAFHYVSPHLKGKRAIVPLVNNERLMGLIQVFKPGGGEREFHSHSAMDGLWFVLKGRARFYGAGEEPVADLGPFDGIFVPRHTAYWFESSGDEMLEILQLEVCDPATRDVVTRIRPVLDPERIETFTPSGALLSDQLVDRAHIDGQETDKSECR